MTAMAVCLLNAQLYGCGEVTYTNLQSLHEENAWGWTIERVVLSDTATVVDFSVSTRPYSRVLVTSCVYLSDEEARHYGVKGAEGLTLNKEHYASKGGKAGFRLVFDPMPRNTRIFDLIDGGGVTMPRWYGLHDSAYRPDFPVAEEVVDSQEVADDSFCDGRAVVRGTIEGYDPFWGDGFVNAVTHSLRDGYQSKEASALVQSDGSFVLDLELEHPVWGYLKGGIRDIPIYVRPGDTLDVTVYPHVPGTFPGLKYESNHPEGCYENLLRCDIYPISSGWEYKDENWETLTDEDFFAMTEQVLEGGLRLCDYAAWKYKLSPWETHLLKNNQRIAVMLSQIGLANRILSYRAGKIPLEQKKVLEYLEDNDYSLYGILKDFPLDDPSLSVSWAFTEMLYPMREMKPMMDALLLAMFNGGATPVDVKNKEDSLQVEALRGILGFKTIPYLVEACLVDKATYPSIWLSPSEREKVIARRAAYITNSYLKRKMWALDSIYARPQLETFRLEGEALEVLKPIMDRYKGKYVQIEWIAPDENGRNLVCNQLVNLIPDFRNHPDLKFVFFFDERRGSKEKIENFIREYLSEEDCRWWGLRESAILRRQFLLHDVYFGHITLDRDGNVFKYPLYTFDENMFRKSLRRLLEKEQEARGQ